MTTIFGICAFDPKLDREYILMASDSQSSRFENTKFVEVYSYNSQKLIATHNKIIAYAGTCVDICAKKDKTKQADKYLRYCDLNRTEILKNLQQVSKEFNNTYIVGSNFDYRLNLLGYCAKYNFLKGLIIIPEIYDSLMSTFRGSGNNYAYNIIKPKLQEHKTFIELEEKILMPIEDLINLSIQGMKEAAKNDEYTGGHMDLAIITNNNIRITRNVVKL